MYDTVIIGAGSIGALKPDHLDSPGSKNALTHANACWGHIDIKLNYIHDVDAEKRKKALKKWGISDQYNNQDIDILVIATPTETHLETLRTQLALYKNLKLIILEKPCGVSLKEAKVFRSLGKYFQIPILVNYSRRFNSSYSTLAIDFKGSKTKINHAKLTYTRGLKREASHAIDLFNWWFGEFQGGQLLQPGSSFDDHSKEDLTYAAYLGYKNCPHVFLCPVDGRDYGVFDIEVFTTTDSYKLVNNGADLYLTPRAKEQVYGDYHCMNYAHAQHFPIDITNNLSYLYDNAVGFLDGEQELKCTIDDAIKVHEVINHLNRGE